MLGRKLAEFSSSGWINLSVIYETALWRSLRAREMSHDGILLLGEGDFSFSFVLEKYMGISKGISKPRIVSSSFDSEEEVAKKYKDAEAWLSKWKDGDGSVKTLHGIDATKDLLSQLGPAAADCKFSSVIFNFPHLGVEDAKLHGAMIAHVMMRARELLLGKGGAGGRGFFILALADAQAERWKANDMATRNNMPLVKQFAFRPNDWPGYKIRRHINGKSFEKRVQLCSFFCYSVGMGGGEMGNAVITLLERILQAEEGACLPAEARSRVKKEKEGKEGKEKQKEKPLKGKRKMRAMAEGHWQSRNPTAQEVEEGSARPNHEVYVCLLCEAEGTTKLFKAEESVVDHVYLRHLHEETKRSTGEGEREAGKGKEESRPMQCPLCEKQIRNKAGLDYHMRAVHGSYGVLKPSWAASTCKDSGGGKEGEGVPKEREEEEEARPALKHECCVCGMLFADKAQLTTHEEAGFQPTDDAAAERATLPCELCGKRFKDRRALHQHMNVCGDKKEYRADRGQGGYTHC